MYEEMGKMEDRTEKERGRERRMWGKIRQNVRAKEAEEADKDINELEKEMRGE